MGTPSIGSTPLPVLEVLHPLTSTLILAQKKINVYFLTMCTFLQKILLRVVILSICIVHGVVNNERNRGIQHYNSSYAFDFDLWINLGK